MPIPDLPENVPRAFVAYWNARNAAGLASLFVEDADFVNVVGLWWNNRTDIEKAHDYGLGTFFRHSTVEVRRTKVRQITDGIAVVHARCKLIGQIDKQGQTLDPRIAIMVFVVQRQNDGWHILTAQNTDVVQGMETNAARSGTVTSLSYRK
ncbi:SgcJ/EcaC family oxidoreductase [Cochlodiniinecator piscidefendens]|uniref:SgcJ/EcaC family oxidoreductase n=1 Tax=Cochlodiniinecator piscidefendens TaxID=2715756 RepID=UPI001409C1A7|nr:SgcJ/EcaC family oxidoreductase [Cochlodiniinecator piscidefendens]